MIPLKRIGTPKKAFKKDRNPLKRPSKGSPVLGSQEIPTERAVSNTPSLHFIPMPPELESMVQQAVQSKKRIGTP